MHVAAVLKRKGNRIVSAAPEDSVAAVTRLLTEHRIGAVLVIDGDGQPVGILSERDVVRAVARDGAGALDRPAADLMTRELITGTPTDTVADMMAVMTQRRIRHVPIVESGRVVGVISIGDVVKARIDDAELEVESLRGYVAGMGCGVPPRLKRKTTRRSAPAGRFILFGKSGVRPNATAGMPSPPGCGCERPTT